MSLSVSRDRVLCSPCFTQREWMHCFLRRYFINYRMVTSEMGLPPQIQSMKWKSSMCFTLAYLVFIYLTVNSTVFHCEWKPHFQLTWKSEGALGSWTTPGCVPWAFWGNVILFLPQVKETKGDHFPHVLWCLVNSTSTTGPVDIWDCISHCDLTGPQIKGITLKESFGCHHYTTEIVLAKYGSN